MRNKKQENIHENKLEEIDDKISECSIKFRSVLLGTDRFHRRYWFMSRMRGIVVETPSSLPPMHSASNWADFKLPDYVKRPQLKDFLTATDEEITATITSSKSSTTKITPNGSMPAINDVTTTTENSNSTKDEPVEEKMEVDENDEAEKRAAAEREKMWSFTPNTSGTKQWLQYVDKEDIRRLHAGLNARGLREKGLKETIEKYFNPLTRGLPIKKQPKKREVSDTDDIFNKNILSCRDYILDIEERIFHADFGDAFNDEEQREKWREFWQHREIRSSIDFMAMLDAEKTELQKFKKGSKIPRTQKPVPDSPLYTIHFTSAETLDEAAKDRLAEVRNLAASVVIMERVLDMKVLNRPLFNMTVKQKGNEKNWKNVLCYQYANWEASILSCKSASALYLHIVHLDECISWAKSPENIRCSICRKKSDAEKMLICDDCEKAYHTYCHKPKVRSIPSGDWFCKRCTDKKAKEASPRKSRRKVADFDEDDEDDAFAAEKPRKRRKVDYRE